MDASSFRPRPNGARTAISLTYDDNAPTHLDHAVPDLEAAGFRGTFYLITGSEAQRARRAEWCEAFLRGHEMGNHTVTHPCRDAGGALGMHAGAHSRAARLMEYCERAAGMGGWGVLVFHGIGGDWLPTSRETHRRIIAHLAEHPGQYWVAPFRDVARHLAGR